MYLPSLPSIAAIAVYLVFAVSLAVSLMHSVDGELYNWPRVGWLFIAITTVWTVIAIVVGYRKNATARFSRWASGRQGVIEIDTILAKDALSESMLTSALIFSAVLFLIGVVLFQEKYFPWILVKWLIDTGWSILQKIPPFR